MNSKQELRRLIRASHPLTKLCRHPRLADAHTVLLYSALPDEVPTQPLLSRLATEGKTVLLPRVVNDTDMELRRYTSLQDLEQGAFGIMEPTGELFTDYHDIDVAVIPGMAFDREGHRLGRGKGYYDRFLTQLPHTYKIGICFPFQLVDHVPADVHDILMDEVIC